MNWYISLYNSILLLLLALGQTAVLGQINSINQDLPVRDALAGQRVMQTFDFEERDIHYLDLPMYWSKVVGKAGFAHYTQAKLDTQYKRSGQYSFKFIPNGSNVGFEYAHRQIPAKLDSDFQISGYVHFENARYCRAQITCGFTDRTGRLIPESEYKSKPFGPDDCGPDGWAKLHVLLPGNFPAARYLTLGLWVLQEEQLGQNDRTEQEIFRRDVNASVWFDDITIYQLPRVLLRTNKPGNVFDADEPVELQIEVEGVGALDYQVHLTVEDANGRLIRDQAWMLAGAEGAAKIDTIPLEQLACGRYQARMDIITEETVIATRELFFGKLAPLSGIPENSGKGFGILALDDNVGDWDTAIRLTGLTNVKLLKLPVWRRQMDQSSAIFSGDSFAQKLDALLKHNVEVVATFSEVPQNLGLKIPYEQRSLMDVLSQDVEFWRPQVDFILAQYVRQIPYWQIGGDQGSEGEIWDPRIKTAVNTMRQVFDKLLNNTTLLIPLNCLFEVGKEQIATDHVALRISSTVEPGQIPQYLEDFRARGLEEIWTTIEPLDEKLYQRDHLLIDFAKRVAFAKKGLSSAIFINHPWLPRQLNAHQLIEPTELFLVFRTLADQLGGSRYLGQFNITPDIPALIFEYQNRPGQGCLFTWNNNCDSRGSESSPPVLLYLGDEPAVVDLFNNRTVLPKLGNLSRLSLTHWPVLLTGIDTRLALLRANLKLSPDVVDASIARQKAQISFTNPFNAPISGKLRFILNEQQNRYWMIEPMTFNFTLLPDQIFSQEVALKFPSIEPGGEKNLNMSFEIDADRTYKINAVIPFEIRLSEIDVNIFTRRSNVTDLLIQQVVTNESDHEISLLSFLDKPDLDHEERTISRLQPGATITKSYRLEQADKWLGKFLRIGLYDPKGTRRINNYIQIN